MKNVILCSQSNKETKILTDSINNYKAFICVLLIYSLASYPQGTLHPNTAVVMYISGP